MSKRVIIECDCGCKTRGVDEDGTTLGWFHLTQPTKDDRDVPKIEGELHFSSLVCLRAWAVKAVNALPNLLEVASNLQPHGMISDKKVKGLYI